MNPGVKKATKSNRPPIVEGMSANGQEEYLYEEEAEEEEEEPLIASEGRAVVEAAFRPFSRCWSRRRPPIAPSSPVRLDGWAAGEEVALLIAEEAVEGSGVVSLAPRRRVHHEFS